MSVRVLPEKRWMKQAGEYVDVWYGEFDTPKGAVRRCGHLHRTPALAHDCVRALANSTWRQSP